MITDTPKKTGPARAFLAELERVLAIINDPADLPGGRKDAHQYDVLPNLLRREADLIRKVFREHCGEPSDESVPAADSDDGQLPLL